MPVIDGSSRDYYYQLPDGTQTVDIFVAYTEWHRHGLQLRDVCERALVALQSLDDLDGNLKNVISEISNRLPDPDSDRP